MKRKLSGTNLFILIMMLLFSLSGKAATTTVWVGQNFSCDATEHFNFATTQVNVEWKVPVVLKNLGGTYLKKLVASQYFEGTAYVTCEWDEVWNWGNPYAERWEHRQKTWEIKCQSNPVSISKQNLELKVGETVQLYYSHKYKNDYTSYASPYFYTGETKVVSVTKSGEITAVGEGTAYVYVHSNISGVTPYCKVNVTGKWDGGYIGEYEFDNIKYVINTETKTAEVIGLKDRKISGELVIPEVVTYKGVDCSVVSIGKGGACKGLDINSVTIPNSVINIGDYAFYGCYKLNTVNIGDNVKYIGKNAFQFCENIKSITLPNSVTNIGEYAFSGCGELNSIKFSESLDSIGRNAFGACKKLISISIPSGVIGKQAFANCDTLTSVTLGKRVASVGGYAFQMCPNLKNVIMEGVKGIKEGAFSNCRKLESINIGENLDSIGERAFAACSKLTSVCCYTERVPSTKSSAFSHINLRNVTLHVPKNAINDYKATEPWSYFGTIKSLTGEEPEMKICATPTINYKDGKLEFSCETEGAELISSITCDDIGEHNEAEVTLSTTYTVSVYANKEGYEDSETATATLCWVECTHEDEKGNDLSVIPAIRLLIQTHAGGVIVLQGVTANIPVTIYNTNGIEIASEIAEPNTRLSFHTGLAKGEVAIIKMGSKSMKVVMR